MPKKKVVKKTVTKSRKVFAPDDSYSFILVLAGALVVVLCLWFLGAIRLSPNAQTPHQVVQSSNSAY